VDLKKIDFSAAAGQVKTLALGEHQKNVFAGETSAQFKPTKPFVFLGLPPS
jgi:choloylglycine hydrolase